MHLPAGTHAGLNMKVSGMKFVKLHNEGREMLVNLCTVSEVYQVLGSDKSSLYFNFTGAEGAQVFLTVDESLDEIYAKSNVNGG